MPLYRTRRMQASYMSTAPQSEPTVRREPSHFHASAVTVYMLSTCLAPWSCHELSCWLSVNVRKRL